MTPPRASPQPLSPSTQGHDLQAQLSEARAATEALRKQLDAAADARQKLQAEVARLGAQVVSLQDEVEREKAASNAYVEGAWPGGWGRAQRRGVDGM